MTAYKDDLEHWYQEYITYRSSLYYAKNEATLALAADEVDETYFESIVNEASSTTNVRDGFCGQCSYIFDNWPSVAERTSLLGEYTSSTIQAGTHAGCQCCRLIFTALQDGNKFDTWRRLESRLQKLGRRSSSYMSIDCRDLPAHAMVKLLSPGLDEHGSSSAEVRLYASKSSLSAAQVVLSHQRTAKTWLETCHLEHQDCRSSVEYLQPTRLLKIINDTVRLVLSSELDSRPRYAALSYSWGAKHFFRLTNETMESLQTGIKLSVLPQLFQDALRVVQDLDITHIWIDALCIIQDSDRDWQTESARMADVYGGSHLTIAASAARDVYAELFSNPLASYGFSVQMQGGDKFIFTEQMSRRAAIDYEYLATRAWALQERLLSSRTLHIGGELGTIWECRSLMATQTLPLGPHSGEPTRLIRAADQPWNWNEIVEAYSSSSLTFTKDKLPALAGLARRQQRLINQEYVVGMWRDRLLWQLAWSGTYADARRSRKCSQALASVRPSWRAPTWSWISVDGPVTFRYEPPRHHIPFIRILDINIELASESDPFGAINSGKLTIACKHLLHSKIDSDRGAGSEQKYGERFIALPQDPGKHRIRLDCVEDELLNEQGDVWILPLFEEKARYYSYAKELRAIVLQRCGAENHYRRIGWLYKDFRHHMDQIFLGGEHLRHMVEPDHISEKYGPPPDDIVITIV